MNSKSESKVISVIVPVYNVEAFLRKCLESIINQTYPYLEIILVDDGSTDNSGSICDQYAACDNRIKVYHKPNGGLSSARNYGLDRASGTYIAYVDSDDWLDVDVYRRCIEMFNDKPKLDVIYYEYDEVYGAGTSKHYYYRLALEGCTHNTLYDELLLAYIWGYYNPAVWNKIYKASLIKDLRFAEGKNYEDVVYTFLASARVRNYSLLAAPGEYTGYFYNKTNVTSISHRLRLDIADLYQQLFEIYDSLEGKIPDLQPYIGSLAYREVINQNLNSSNDEEEITRMMKSYAKRIAKMKQIPSLLLKDKLKHTFLCVSPSLFVLFFCKWIPKLRTLIR